MKYYHSHRNDLDVKIIAWFLSCLLSGAFLGLVLKEPNTDMVRRRYVPVKTRRMELIDDQEEEELVEYENAMAK